MNPYLLFLLLLFIVLHWEMFPPKKFFWIPCPWYLWMWSCLDTVFADVKKKWSHTESGWALDSMTSALRRKEGCGGRDYGHVKMRQRSSDEAAVQGTARIGSHHQKLGGSTGLFHGVSEGVWPCWCLDFRLLASRTVRDYTSFVLSHSICGHS